MFERILVPLDGSRFSSSSLKYATEVVKRFNSDMVLLQVVGIEPPPSHVDVAGLDGDTLLERELYDLEKENTKHVARAKRYFADKCRTLNKQGIRCSYQVVTGTPGKSIIDFCQKHHIHLVIMTTRGRGGFKRAILGSVADEVIRKHGISVLAID